MSFLSAFLFQFRKMCDWVSQGMVTFSPEDCVGPRVWALAPLNESRTLKEASRTPGRAGKLRLAVSL